MLLGLAQTSAATAININMLLTLMIYEFLILLT
mgnify:CR=1 FL=1